MFSQTFQKQNIASFLQFINYSRQDFPKRQPKWREKTNQGGR